MMSSWNSNSLWKIHIFNNPVSNYVLALGLFIVFYLLLFLLRRFITQYLSRIVKRTKTDFDDVILHAILKIKSPIYYYIAFYFAVQTLKFPAFVGKLFLIILIILITYQIIISAQIGIDYFVKKISQREENEGTQYAYQMMAKIGKGILWIFGLLVILSNLNINVTSLITGLGIGGVAIALALQNILGDLFSSFAIYFDKPFVVGDFIIVGDKMGVVQKIGIKTTRIQALQGEEIVISNKDLTASQIQNFKKMQERRIVFSFGVIYETPQEKLKKIPGMVKKIITNSKDTRFDRAHFLKFDDSALYFEVVYYVLTGDYNTYMDIQQSINFTIKERFEKDNIIMAYPTQTIYMAKS
jgi:small-conductance mechanosensitive channel